jgi:excisionase family DNA binding protein
VSSPPLPVEVPEVLKAETVGKILKCSKATVYAMAARKELPSVLIAGKIVRFLASDVTEYLMTRRRAG